MNPQEGDGGGPSLATGGGASDTPRRCVRIGGEQGNIECFNAWSGGLASYGVQAAYALIAANWAVHGASKSILTNDCARWSMLVAIAFLGVHLLVVFFMTQLYKERCDYIDENKRRWSEEFSAAREVKAAWPHTDLIERLATFKRWLLFVGPAASGLLLILSVFA